MVPSQLRMALGLALVFLGLASAASTGGGGDCPSILEQTSALSDIFAKRIAHGIHSLTLADLRYYFNPNANETNNIPTINRNLTSSIPILNDAPDIGRSDRFKTMGLLVAEEVLLNENQNWDLKNADTLEKLVHALHMHEMWTETSKLYKQILENPPASNICPCLADVENNGIYYYLRNNAMLIREPELGFNEENKRMPRGGRSRSYCRRRRSAEPGPCCGCGDRDGDPNSIRSFRWPVLAKRSTEAQEEDQNQMMKNGDTQATDKKTHYIDLFDEIADMTDPISSDLALFLFCMLN